MNARTGDLKNKKNKKRSAGKPGKCVLRQITGMFQKNKKNPLVSNFLTLYSAFECSVVNGLCDKRFDDGVTLFQKLQKNPWVSSFLTLCSAFECSIGLGITHTCACVNVSINVVALLLFLYSTLSVSVPLLMSQLCQCWNESTSKGEHNCISNIKYQELFQGGKKGHIIFMMSKMIPWPTIWQCKRWSVEQQQKVCIQVLFIALLTKKCPECLLSLHVLPCNFMPLPVLYDSW